MIELDSGTVADIIAASKWEEREEPGGKIPNVFPSPPTPLDNFLNP